MTEQRARQIVEPHIVEPHYVASCCWPFWDRGGALFWGAALLALGGIWLTANILGLENWGEWVVPGLFVAWGAALLIGVAGGRRPST